MKKLNFIILGIGIFVLFSFQFVFAKTDLSISTSDVVFSKEEPIEGERIRIFARVFNLGDKDVYGEVIFLNNGEKLAEIQPISIRTNTYDDVLLIGLLSKALMKLKSILLRPVR